MPTVSKVAAAIALAGTVAGVGIGVSSADSAPAGPAPRVAVIGLGGTIAGTSDRRTDLETYRPGTRPIAELVDSLRPEIGEIAAVSTEDFGQKGSGDYTVTDLYDLARLVESRLRDHDSVVVSTGSATMEELSYFLDLTVRSTKPVVVTGAMRPWTAIGSDGPVNLYNAIRLAASNRTTCFGTVIALNDQILPARNATKSDSTRVHTFTTREYGDLGTDTTRPESGCNAPRPRPTLRRPRPLADPVRPDHDQPRRPPARRHRPQLPRRARRVRLRGRRRGRRGIVFAGTPSPKQASAAMATKDNGAGRHQRLRFRRDHRRPRDGCGQRR